MITRRTLLHAAGLVGAGGVAGCIAPSNPSPADSRTARTGTRPSERDHPADATHVAAVTSEDPAPDLPVAPGVSLVDPYVTTGSPPVLRVDVENTTEESVTIGEYRTVVFQYVYGTDSPLVWLPHSERSTTGEPDRSLPDLTVVGDGCWKLDSRPATTEEYGTTEVPVGGTLTAFVGLYATPDAGDCLPTGEHRFEATYTYFPEGIEGDEREDTRWGFSLSVEPLEGSA